MTEPSQTSTGRPPIAQPGITRRITTVRERSESYASYWIGKNTLTAAEAIVKWCSGDTSQAANIQVRAYNEDANALYDTTLLSLLDAMDVALPSLQTNNAGQVCVRPGMCVSAGVYNFAKALVFVSRLSASKTT